MISHDLSHSICHTKPPCFFPNWLGFRVLGLGLAYDWPQLVGGENQLVGENPFLLRHRFHELHSVQYG